ncbi:MAG: ROK family protein [Clostridia bacterium]|nr:ROK family protein [Clostridia bacterium]
MKRLVLDVGGSAIKYAVMEDDLSLTEKGKLEGRQPDAAHFADAVRGLRARFPDAEGVAVSYCGEVDPLTGQVLAAGSYACFDGVNLKAYLEKELGTTVWVEKDANCAALAEARLGVLRNERFAAVLIFGTGMGCGLLLDGKLHYGAHCRSALATLASTSRRAFVPKFRVDDSLRFWNGKIRRRPNPTGIDGIRFFRKVKGKNPFALRRFHAFTRHVARFIADLQMTLDLEAIAIGGGVSAEPVFISGIREAVDREWNNKWVKLTQTVKPEIKVCSTGNDANLIGALLHFRAMESERKG